MRSYIRTTDRLYAQYALKLTIFHWGLYVDGLDLVCRAEALVDGFIVRSTYIRSYDLIYVGGIDIESWY